MNNCKIAGSGTVGGGEYNEIKIAGSGKIDGDVKCSVFKAAGSVHALGDIECAGELSCSGSFKCDKTIKAKDANFSGSTKIAGFSGGELNCSGSTTVTNEFKSEIAKFSGAFSCKCDVETEEFRSNGKTEIDGQLNAGDAEIILDGSDSHIKSIVGGHIVVECRGFRQGGFFAGLFSLRKNNLITDLIEADLAELENVKANTVRVSKVILKGDCEIELVEYSEDYSAQPSCKVKKVQKV